ncbi:DUF4267 domain-containing protein [Streptomyces sp. SPB074]|uniref:DUF4267 domain-containing protein n=1 Tax=Streptomyces sp. (strain SPB074) TaxID=465543 RepID=UPI00017F140A|nr:DUF4267 domain-containing protein [Streptomyces sp. SPB074]
MPHALTTTATVIVWVIAVGIMLIGVRFQLTTRALTDFGIPATPAGQPAFRAWGSVKGNRDITLGLMLLIALLGASDHLVGWMTLAGALAAAADALAVRFSGGRAKDYLGVHGATAAVSVAAGIVLLLS